MTFNELRRLLPSTWTLDQLAYQTISIEANVTESLTGITLSSEKEIRCQRYYYKIEFAPSTPNNFKPGLNFEAYVIIFLKFKSSEKNVESIDLNSKNK